MAFLISLALASQAVAAPTISATSGTIGTNNNLTISGSGFGTKTRSKPWVYADFQTTDTPHPTLSHNTSWRETGNNARTNDANNRWGTGSTRSNWAYNLATRATTRRLPEFPGVTWGSKYMVSYWVKSDITNYDGAPCCSAGETNCTYNWKIGPRVYDGYGLTDHYPNVVSASVAGDEGCGGASHDQEKNFRITVEVTPDRNISGENIITFGTAYGFPNTTWRRETFLYEMNSGATVTDGAIIIKKGNATVVSDSTFRYSSAANPTLPDDVFIQHAIANENVSVGKHVWWSDIYADDSWSRVEIGNAATYAACTQLEVQPYTSWTNTAITINQRRGTLSGNTWAYVFDNNNDCNATGYPLATVVTPPPTITSISPASGPAAGGTTVTMTGTGYIATPSVTVAGVNATGENYVGSTQITFVTPAGTAGTLGNVVVTNPDSLNATLTNGFSYDATPPPPVTEIAPIGILLWGRPQGE